MIETWLPLFNTLLILISGIALVIGYIFIRKRNITYHRRAMITATVFAALFLIVYVTRALLYTAQGFDGQGTARTIYLIILGTHTVLATAIIPMVLITLYRALRRQYPRHRRIARITLPVWLYVVVTGWLIYIMLYQINWARI